MFLVVFRFFGSVHFRLGGLQEAKFFASQLVMEVCACVCVGFVFGVPEAPIQHGI